MPGLLDPYRLNPYDPYTAALDNSLLAPPPMAGSMFDTTGDTAPGLEVPGNVNLHRRPAVQNPNGSVSTVRSMTFQDADSRSVVVPSVIWGRGIVGPDEAFKHYQQTGEQLGIFDNPDDADAYARALHEQQAREYIFPR
jgi:hypothetical protein